VTLCIFFNGFVVGVNSAFFSNTPAGLKEIALINTFLELQS
jgi:uncharacterized membrane protein SpoIIM required for sporulation